MQSPYHLELNVRAIRHHLFNSQTLVNDIAVVIFDPPIQDVNDYVRPICLDTRDNVEEYESCYVTGWGQTREGQLCSIHYLNEFVIDDSRYVNECKHFKSFFIDVRYESINN